MTTEALKKQADVIIVDIDKALNDKNVGKALNLIDAFETLYKNN